jgi:cytochrome c oxidase subunit 3
MTPAALTNKLLVDVPPQPVGAPRRRPRVEPALLGVLVFIATEIMFFAGLLSAYNIARAKVPMSVWPPPDQPRLPIESTAANSAVLVLSGVLLWLAVRAWKQQKNPLPLALAASALGAVFVAVQGYEWSSLLAQGLTMTRSTFASFFYLIVGTHGLHVLGGLIGVAVVVRGMVRGTATPPQLQAAAIFWTFVVAVWPVVYVMVYL